MDYGDIIKRAWLITWRYKALWVLGLFAGISGCQSGGNSSGGRSQYRTDSNSISRDLAEVERAFSRVEQWIPYLLAVFAVFFILWILWALVSVVARGGLVKSVGEADDERPAPVGEGWSAGVSRFWSLLGLHAVLKLPVFLLSVMILAVIIIPVVVAVAGGDEPGPGVIVPVCGGLLAIPLLILLALVLDVIFILALRYMMLGGQHTMESVRNAWSFLKARFKDTAVMYLLNGVMNVGAGIVVSIITVLLAAGAGITAVGGAFAGDLPITWALVPIGLLVVLVVLLYTAIWGTFTSSIWTVYFRRVTGMWVAPVPVYAPEAPAPQPYTEPTMAPGPPVASPETYPAPGPEATPASQPPLAPQPPREEPPA